MWDSALLAGDNRPACAQLVSLRRVIVNNHSPPVGEKLKCQGKSKLLTNAQDACKPPK